MASFEEKSSEQERLQVQVQVQVQGESPASPSAGAVVVRLEEAADYESSVQLYRGHLSVPGLNEEDLPKTKVNIFISSTFDDTKFEQDVLLKVVYPRLR